MTAAPAPFFHSLSRDEAMEPAALAEAYTRSRRSEEQRFIFAKRVLPIRVGIAVDPALQAAAVLKGYGTPAKDGPGTHYWSSDRHPPESWLAPLHDTVRTVLAMIDGDLAIDATHMFGRRVSEAAEQLVTSRLHTDNCFGHSRAAGPLNFIVNIVPVAPLVSAGIDPNILGLRQARLASYSYDDYRDEVSKGAGGFYLDDEESRRVESEGMHGFAVNTLHIADVAMPHRSGLVTPEEAALIAAAGLDDIRTAAINVHCGLRAG